MRRRVLAALGGPDIERLWANTSVRKREPPCSPQSRSVAAEEASGVGMPAAGELVEARALIGREHLLDLVVGSLHLFPNLRLYLSPHHTHTLVMSIQNRFDLSLLGIGEVQLACEPVNDPS